MKKIVSFSFIVITLSVLINCSPKTAKKVASTENSSSQRVKPSEIPFNGETVVIDAENSAATKSKADAESGLPASLTNMGIDEQINLFKEVVPLKVEMGHKVFLTKCNKCHDYYLPETRTQENWVKVMTVMGPKANLSTEQYIMVSGYLVQNAKQ